MKYRFADCVVDTKQGRLYRAGKVVDITPKVFDVLVDLLEQRGRLVSREALLDRHWSGLYVTDGTLTTLMGRIRRVVGHSSSQPILETIRKKGYRFVAEVSVSEAANHEYVPETAEATALPPELSEPEPAATESSEPVSVSSALPEVPAKTISVAAERRQLTILCCQRIGDSDPLDTDDVEEYYQHEQQLRQWCLECFTPLGGHLAQSMSDTLMFYFGYPQAFEDNAQRALLAALRLLEQLQSLPREWGDTPALSGANRHSQRIDDYRISRFGYRFDAIEFRARLRLWHCICANRQRFKVY